MEFVQAVIDGLLIGGVYAVISIGLTLVYGVMGIVNFAQAEFVMIGMFVAWFAWAWLGLDPVLAAPLSFAMAFAIGWVVQGHLIARVLKAPSVAQIFLTVGLLIVFENGALMMFGSQFRSVTTSYQTMSLSLGPLFVSLPYLIAFGMSLACGTALWWFMRSSWFGRAMRATAFSRSTRPFTSSTTPPTSERCNMSGDAILTTIGKPTSCARSMASPALPTTIERTKGTP